MKYCLLFLVVFASLGLKAQVDTDMQLAQHYYSLGDFEKAEKHIGKIDLVHLNVIFPLGIWALWLKWFQNIPYVIVILRIHCVY